MGGKAWGVNPTMVLEQALTEPVTGQLILDYLYAHTLSEEEEAAQQDSAEDSSNDKSKESIAETQIAGGGEDYGTAE